jgi:hypothetical protein
MRFLSALLGVVAVAAVLFVGSPSVARADSPEAPAPCAVAADEGAPVVAQAGTDAEARAYEQREATSPDVQDFAGGDVVIGVSILALVVIVLIVVLLMHD